MVTGAVQRRPWQLKQSDRIPEGSEFKAKREQRGEAVFGTMCWDLWAVSRTLASTLGETRGFWAEEGCNLI